MTTKEAIKHFKGKLKLAQALDIWPSAVSGWGKYPPKLRQYQIESITNKVLKVTEKAG